MSVIEFFKANWAVLVPILLALLAIVVPYYIYCRKKKEEKVRSEEEFKKDISERVAKLESRIEMLTTFYPQLKSLEKLENFDKFNLTAEDIKETVSEVLKTTIDTRTIY